MSPATLSSLRVHRLVQHIKSQGFWLETDEVEELGPLGVLESCYDLRIAGLSQAELDLLREEMLSLAEENEIREGMVKYREVAPTVAGFEICHQVSRYPDGRAAVASYPVEFSYPIQPCLKGIRPRGGASFSVQEKKPLAKQGTNWR